MCRSAARLSPTLPALLAGALLAAGLPCAAQVTQDFAVDLHATASTAAPVLTLGWVQRQQAAVTTQRIHRRAKGATTWVLQATLTVDDVSYPDPTAAEGVEYEYRLERVYTGLSPSTPIAYLAAGANVPAIENRGTLLLLIDDTMTAPLAPEIAQLQDDLAGDGWTVQTISVARDDTPPAVRALIQAAYNADPANVKAVYLLGHVPVPYSGNLAPDGHGNHVGAWPADGYYGDVNGTWTDTTVTSTTASPPRTQNVPGDGKFDQSSIPSDLELQVGRVDLADMTLAPGSGASELTLLRRYLRKAHDYRHRLGAYAAVPRRSMIRDGFGYFGGESFASSGWAAALSCVGPEVDLPPSGGWYAQATANTYLFGHGDGGGSFTSASGVGTSTDFGRRPSRVVFTEIFGSYHGDWDATNNFMRSVLAGNATGDSLGLTCCWSGRPNWFLHPAGLGENIGYAARLSMNNSFSNYAPANSSARGVHEGFMGDPTLRFHMVEPPRGCSATSSAGQVALRWDASTESALLGYHVYRAVSPAGAFTRLTATPLATTTITDTTATTGLAYRYLVRTLKLETVPGGTYQNPSQGALATITVSAAATPPPFGPGNLAVQPLSSVQTVLTWTDNSSDETGFRLERKVNTNNFATLTTLGANATTFTDTSVLQNVNVYYYRVVAVGAGGSSLPSNEVWVDAHPGYFDLTAARLKVNRASGSVAMLVNRFGNRNGPAQVTGATSNVSAIAGTHYTAVNAPVAFANGENSTQPVNVALATGGPPQLPRQFTYTLSNPTVGASIAVQNLTRVLIEDSSATLPAPWLQAIVGAVTDSSPAVYAEGALGSAVAGGSSATSDNGRFIYQSRTGDAVLTAFIDTPLNVQANARFAVLVRGSNADDVVMASTQVGGATTAGTFLATRTAVGGALTLLPAATNSLIAPRWIRLSRSGNIFTSDTSTDGVNWTVLGSATVAVPATANWGLFHSGDTSGNFQTARFLYTTLTAPGVVAAPGNFVLTSQAPAQIQLVWDQVGGAAGYRLERRPRNGNYAPVQTFAAGVATFTDTNVVAGVTYDYRVMAFSGATDSAWTASSVTAPGAASAYTQWLELRGLPMDGSGNGAPTAAPAGDSIANAMKFALGINPFLSGYLGRLTHGLTSDAGQTYVSLTYIRPEPPPAGVLYNVRTGSDLTGWSAAQTVEVSNIVTGSVRTITIRDTQPASEANPHRFIRLEVTVP